MIFDHTGVFVRNLDDGLRHLGGLLPITNARPALEQYPTEWLHSVGRFAFLINKLER